MPGDALIGLAVSSHVSGVTATATFDHVGNIFVVEWVEVGRVTKLRKV